MGDFFVDTDALLQTQPAGRRAQLGQANVLHSCEWVFCLMVFRFHPHHTLGDEQPAMVQSSCALAISGWPWSRFGMLNGCLMLPQVYTTMVTNNSERFRGHFGTVMNSQSKGLLVHFTVLACLLTGTVCGCVSEDAWPLIVCKKSSCQNVMPKLHKFAFLQFVWSDFTLHTCVDSLEFHCSY